MMLEVYEQTIENTVSPSIVSCGVQRAEGALAKRGCEEISTNSQQQP
jgi:hypothetical protein